MKKYLILLSFSFFCSVTYANTKVINALEEGGKLIFIRHAYAPGEGDPKNFDITRCSSQRNLDATGIKQSKRIGKFFRDNKISIDLVLSSEWCRCKDTAKNAFKNYKTFKALNSFFSSKFAKNKEEQIKELKAFVKNWNSKKNMVFVTHYVVISEVLGVNVKSGMVVVVDKKFKIIGTIETN